METHRLRTRPVTQDYRGGMHQAEVMEDTARGRQRTLYWNDSKEDAMGRELLSVNVTKVYDKDGRHIGNLEDRYFVDRRPGREGQ